MKQNDMYLDSTTGIKYILLYHDVYASWSLHNSLMHVLTDFLYCVGLLTNVSEHVWSRKHFEYPSLRVWPPERLGQWCAHDDLCKKEHCANDTHGCADYAETEVDRVGSHHIHVIAERQTDEGGGVRTGHSPQLELAAVQCSACRIS